LTFAQLLLLIPVSVVKYFATFRRFVVTSLIGPSITYAKTQCNIPEDSNIAINLLTQRPSDTVLKIIRLTAVFTETTI
jgi:hypothetical protein